MGNAALTPSYKKCANETEKCNFSGRKSVVYTDVNAAKQDARNSLYYATFINSDGPVECVNESFFRDPSPGNRKMCMIADIPNDIKFDDKGVPIGFTKCADEKNICIPEKDSDIIYTAGGEPYVYIQTHGGFPVPCNSNTFGNLQKDTKKSCWFRYINSPSPITPPTYQPSIPTKNNITLIVVIISICILFIIILIIFIIIKRRKKYINQK